MTALLVVQAGATLSLTGLVWFVQLVHYPLFGRVDPDSFPAYEEEHTRRTTWVAAPLMAVEALAVAGLLVVDPGPWTVAGALLVVGIWVSTFLVQVPCHRALAKGFDPVTHRRLVRSNWARTAMWTARSVIALALLV